MSLPPGFRFHPTDQELVAFYLSKKVKGITIEYPVIADVDLYKCEPWDLPSKTLIPSDDLEWFFFSPRDRKYPNGARTNRATEAGYWKATGRDRFVKTGSKTIGMKKTLVFYTGRAPHGERTDWLMHEYRLDGEEWEATTVPQDAYVLCRVFKKNGFSTKPADSGLDVRSDRTDSPSEEHDPAMEEYEMKPGLSLAPRPSSNSIQVAPLAAIPLDQQVKDTMPLATATPVALGQYFIGNEEFDLDAPFNKMDDNIYMLPDFGFPEDSSDFFGTVENPTADVPTESKGWMMQEQSSADSFDGLDLPPLTEDYSPDHPSLPQFPTSYDYRGVVDDVRPSTIQIRPRSLSGLRSPNVRGIRDFTASRHVKFGKSKAACPAKQCSAGAANENGSNDIDAVIEPESEREGTETGEVLATSSQSSGTESLVASVEDGLSPSAQSPSGSVVVAALSCDVEGQAAGSASSSLRREDSQIESLDHHPLMKADVDNQKPSTGLFNIKGFGDLPPGIGSIHVNAVTISCSCEKVPVKPHAQTTVCECYNKQVLQVSRGPAEGQKVGDGHGIFKTSSIAVFLMGGLTACVGLAVSKGVWTVLRSVVHIA